MHKETFRPLETTYCKYGYRFIQVKRKGLVAIYEQRDEDSNRLIGYEVFVIIEKGEEYVGPKKYYQPKRELVPSTTSWGVTGFTTKTLEKAEEHFNRLLEMKPKESRSKQLA